MALANYHFGSKQGLLEAVIARRAQDLNAERLARLDAVLAAGRGRKPSLEAIIDAFTHPLLDRSARGGPGWKSYFALVAEVNNSPEFGGVLVRCNHPDAVCRPKTGQAIYSALEKSAFAQQRKGMLGMILAGNGPETGAAAARHDDGLDGDRGGHGGRVLGGL